MTRLQRAGQLGGDAPARAIEESASEPSPSPVAPRNARRWISVAGDGLMEI
ncbi:hypothetical protein N9262_04815 [Akkermansiaceae bacterium]|nr:hypothetical protein [Akkermansiaceae bacterium]